MFKRLIILGASKGLGRALALHSHTQFQSLKEITLVARKVDSLKKVAQEMGETGFQGQVAILPLDLSDDSHQIPIQDFDLVIYAAGGGPHGEFVKKDWKDHRWALQLNLFAPMKLVHQWLRGREKAEALGTFVVVGSRIAENKPDPLAASYSAGKSGLHGFMSSLQPELEGKQSHAWLFSPGYMDTEMLPLTAKVRHDGSKLMSAEAAALALLRWLKKDEPWHRVLN